MTYCFPKIGRQRYTWQVSGPLYLQTWGFGFAFSNSSFQLGKGTTAWILEGQNANNHMIGECFAPGMDDNHSSFCSELVTGVYMLLLFLKSCAPLEGIWKLNLQAACNSKSVLHCLWQTAPTSPSKPHYDLLSGTKFLLGQCWVYYYTGPCARAPRFWINHGSLTWSTSQHWSRQSCQR